MPGLRFAALAAIQSVFANGISIVPELAEVEHSRRLWDVGIGLEVEEVLIRRPEIRIFRGTDVTRLREGLEGRVLVSSLARGKQMAFRFGAEADRWLGVHLGMAGRLRVEPPEFRPAKHDYLALAQRKHWLVFSDRRFFGRIRFHQGEQEPEWWHDLPPSILDRQFTLAAVDAFLRRRRKTPLKALLLMQERFPGVGNWMADEILWRARLHPSRPAGDLGPEESRVLWRVTRDVCRRAIEVMDQNWDYPDTWLFAHRWEDDGQCPRCGAGLQRAEVGGRTTCWCPRCQPEKVAQDR